jgi:hypothetical protein
MGKLILGPVLRYVGEREATIWVETDEACEVEVLDHGTPTFEVEGHHYAMVQVDGLEPGTCIEYEVALDGERVWPEPDSEFPPSVIRTIHPEGTTDIIFGSCRTGFPHTRPFVLTKDEHDDGREYDALYAKAHEMLEQPVSEWPDMMLLLGDQVYADEVSPQAREFIRSRRDPEQPPGMEVADFEEYTALYNESWSDPVIRWLFSTVSSSMTWDDHDVHDDWNISRSWLEAIRSEPWWQERIVSALMTYWIYQHAGNLSHRELAEDSVYRMLTKGSGDGGPALREWAERAHLEPEGSRWSFHRDIGRTRLIMMDSRAGRVLEHGRRSMFDDEEWEWIAEHAKGDFDHLLLGTSVPYLLGPGMHYIEAWSEALTEGAWGKYGARFGEWMRRTLDFDHWASFSKSFHRLAELLREMGAGERGEPPASIVVLSGDVHHAYLAEVGFPRGSGVRSAVYQAVCSPFRNPLDKGERRGIRFGVSAAARRIGRALARTARVEDPEIRWRFVEGPYFDNQVATLHLDGRRASLCIEKTIPDEADEHGPAELDKVFEHQLA